MTPTVIIFILAGILLAALIALLIIGRDRYRLRERVGNLNQELIEVSADASVGRRAVLGCRHRVSQSLNNRSPDSGP